MAEKKDNFYRNGLKFECQRCSFCCGHGPGFVYLSYDDLAKLCTYFNLSETEFVQKYCRWVNYYYGQTVLALFEKKNYDCVLWNNGCSAYQARPVQCSTYPFWTWMIEDGNVWNDCGKDCPGINKGKIWSVEEIEEQKKAYDSIEVIQKEDFESRFGKC